MMLIHREQHLLLITAMTLVGAATAPIGESLLKHHSISLHNTKTVNKKSGYLSAAAAVVAVEPLAAKFVCSGRISLEASRESSACRRQLAACVICSAASGCAVAASIVHSRSSSFAVASNTSQKPTASAALRSRFNSCNDNITLVIIEEEEEELLAYHITLCGLVV